MNTVAHGLAAQRRLDRFERRVRLAAIGSARLRHVGTAAAALAAERLRTLLHEIDGVETRGQVVGHADDDAGLAVAGEADDGDDAGADLLLPLVGKAAQILQFDAGHRARDALDAVDLTHAV